MSAGLDTDRSVAALRRTSCCGCDGPMNRRGEVAVILLDKRAEWTGSMTWGNVMVEGSGGRAVAVLCPTCLHDGNPPKTAVELREDGSVVHHPVVDLVDVPEVREKDLPP
jgi:hypothetical protein